MKVVIKDYVLKGNRKFVLSSTDNICNYKKLVVEGKVFYIYLPIDITANAFTLVSNDVNIKFSTEMSSRAAWRAVRRYLEGLPVPEIFSAHSARIKKFSIRDCEFVSC